MRNPDGLGGVREEALPGVPQLPRGRAHLACSTGRVGLVAAVNYAGTTQRVCGPFAGTGSSNDDVFLNLGRDYPDPERLQIVLWDVGSVEPITNGATLCASGQITLYEGVAQIELQSASLVEIYG